MSRATSIAGVRPLGWLARLRARRALLLGVGVPSAVAGRMARALRGWGQSRRCRRIPLLAPRRWRQAEARVRTVRRMARMRVLCQKIKADGKVL